jgi:hypothetical protein
MTQKEIIELARQAGFIWGLDIGLQLEAFAKLVEDAAFKRWAAQTKLAVEDEREACAKTVADLKDKSGVNEDGNAWLTRIKKSDCVQAIRARGEA